MKNVINSWMLVLWNNVGHCPKCIKSSFQFALVMWLVTALAIVFRFVEASWVSGVVACLATLLWCLHILAWAFKDVRRSRDDSAGSEGTSSSPDVSRRRVLPLFARSLALVAFSTVALPGAITSAFCATCPTSSCKFNSDCGSNSSCYCSSTGSCVS